MFKPAPQSCLRLALRLSLVATIAFCAAAAGLRAEGEELPAAPQADIDPNSPVDLPPVDVRAEFQALSDEVAKLKAAEAKRGQADADRKQADAARPTFRPLAFIHLDDYSFGQDTLNRATVGDIPDGAAFRRAQAGFQGEYKVTEYRFVMDFAQPGRPTFLDVWGAVNDLPLLGQLKIGHFFEPFGLDRLTPARFMTFLERHLDDQAFSPIRSPGIQAQNQYADDHGVWTLGVFRSRTDQFGDAVTDTGDWAVTGRLTALPWFDEPSGGRYFLHLGTAHSYRRTIDHLLALRAQPEARLGAATPNVPFFVDTGLIASDQHSLHEVEFACGLGSLYFQAEYTFASIDQLGGPQLWFHGWYAQAGYFLTGEHRPYNRTAGVFDRVTPFTEFFRVRGHDGVCQGWGAWELAARLSYLDLTSANIGGGELTDLTVGLNWYLTPFMKLQANYIHAFLDPAAVPRSGADIFGMRFHYDF